MLRVHVTICHAYEAITLYVHMRIMYNKAVLSRSIRAGEPVGHLYVRQEAGHVVPTVQLFPPGTCCAWVVYVLCVCYGCIVCVLCMLCVCYVRDVCVLCA
jgi:hypothetical protein